MTTLTVAATAFSTQSAHDHLAYGTLAILPVKVSAAEVYLRAPLDKIPARAVVTSAVLTFYTHDNVSGSFTYNVHRITGTWSSGLKWYGLPAVSAAIASLTKSNPVQGTAWAFDVTATVQAMVAGTTPNRGFALKSASSTISRVFGTTASTWQPTLVVAYTVVPDVPGNLHPASGAVTVAKPQLSWDTIDGTTQIQVQVDPAANPGTAWDSGAVAASGGLLDLATTSYPGLSVGSSTQWRARQNNGYGWSDWSPWVGFQRVTAATLTITSPAPGSVADGSPPTVWSVTGQTQVAWQVRLLDAVTGEVLADSDRNPGTDTAWTPPTGLGSDGATGVIEVTIWGDQDHAATATDPEYVQGTVDITLDLDPTVAPVATLDEYPSGFAPDVILVGTRSTIPDYVDLYRDSVKVARFVGTDVFTGTTFQVTDVSAPVNRATTYRVAPVVNGATAKGGPTVAVTPTCRGIWLIDTQDPTQRAAIWTGDDQDQSQPEVSVVHTPVGGKLASQVVRRRLARFRPQGAVAGTVITVGDYAADDSEAFLRTVEKNDAGHLYRLCLGGSSPVVIVGDVTFTERPTNSMADRVLGVAFNWWSQKEA